MVVEAQRPDGTVEKSIMVAEPTEAVEVSEPTKFVEVVKRGITKATDGLTNKLRGVCIIEGTCIGVSMIEISPQAEMEFDLELEELEEQDAFLEGGENMVDFLCRCQRNKYEVMLCPRCGGVFIRKAA